MEKSKKIDGLFNWHTNNYTADSENILICVQYLFQKTNFTILADNYGHGVKTIVPIGCKFVWFKIL